MMRTILISLTLAVTALASEKWPKAEFSEVRAYYYQPKGPQNNSILLNDKLHPSVVNKEGALLSAAQVDRLTAALSSNVRYNPARCYSPHHGFVFYDRKHKPVAVAEICLDCMNDRITPERRGFTDYPAIADLLEELKLPLGTAAGSAKAYRKRSVSWRADAGNTKP